MRITIDDLTWPLYGYPQQPIGGRPPLHVSSGQLKQAIWGRPVTFSEHPQCTGRTITLASSHTTLLLHGLWRSYRDALWIIQLD